MKDNNWNAVDFNKNFAVFFTLIGNKTVRQSSGLANFKIDELKVEVYYEEPAKRPRNGYFTGTIVAKSIKIGDIEILEEDLRWLKETKNKK